MPASSTLASAELRISLPEAKKSATRPDQRIALMAGEQSGVIASRQLAACDLDACAVKVRADRGSPHLAFHGVYAVGPGALTRTGLFTAAVLACGDDAILGHYAAAARPVGRARRCRGHRPALAGRRIEGIRAHRSRVDPRDVWRRGGILITSPARTILDLGAAAAASRASGARGRPGQRPPAVVDRHRGHRGVARLRRLIADGYVPTRSELEDRALDLILQAAFPKPEINPRLEFDGQPIRPDMFFRELGVVIELDGARWHDDPLTRQDDADKQAILEAHGLRVLGITWRQLVDHPRQTIARIRAALSR